MTLSPAEMAASADRMFEAASKRQRPSLMVVGTLSDYVRDLAAHIQRLEAEPPPSVTSLPEERHAAIVDLLLEADGGYWGISEARVEEIHGAAKELLAENSRVTGELAQAHALIEKMMGDAYAKEAYCLASGRPVRYGAGDRCVAHGDADRPCTAGLRVPQCTHPRGGSNGSERCQECGRSLPTGRQILELRLEPGNDSGAVTVGGYLTALLEKLVRDPGSFNSTKAFGNSDWIYDLYIPMILAGWVNGEMDADGIDRCDDAAAEALILKAVRALGTPQ